ncbi:GDP-mannose 4,6-dehydratase [Legionella lytica]|uniref:GDP-mannose 4,6-dehydratase n=1 Tax=Legionella lytica TaxID=96232 RepID=A0ABW8DA98_9GAMM
MLNVLITGIEGFTGRYLAQTLRLSGYNVKGLTRQSTLNGFCGDLLEYDSLINVLAQFQPDIVIHLAAISFVAHSNVDAIYRTNVEGTQNLLKALVVSGSKPQAVLLASSATVYGNVDSSSIDESVQPSPVNDYGRSKLAMEEMAKTWSEQLPIIITRPFNYTGPGQSLNFLLPKIVDHYTRRAPVIELGNLDVIRDFSDVRTVVKSYQLLIEAKPCGETFNICSGQGHSLHEVLNMMKDLTGHELKVQVNPAYVRKHEVRQLVGSQEKLNATIGAISRVSLVDTLKWMLQEVT